jgi:hypothetical protein
MPAVCFKVEVSMINSLRKCLRIGSLKVRIPCRRASSELCSGHAISIFTCVYQRHRPSISQNARIGRISQECPTVTEANYADKGDKGESTTDKTAKNKHKEGKAKKRKGRVNGIGA